MRTPIRLNRLGRLTRLLTMTAALIAVIGASAVASASTTTTASAASVSVTYSLVGMGTSVPGGVCLDCQPPTMVSSGTATCTACLAGKPASGSFAISLVVHTFPPSPCKVKEVTGTLGLTWNNGTTSSAAVDGKFKDSNALLLSGTFGTTDAVYPSDQAAILLSNFPPSPCLAATNPITGTLALSVP